MTQATAGMTVEQQLGQLFMVGFSGTEPSPEIARLLVQDQVGGVILFSRNLGNAQQTLALTSQLQAIARSAGHRHPLLIATDQENGLVHRLGADSTRFPGNMALGAVGDERLTFEVAQATARELRAQGINMNLAPVADVNNNPANPVIGVRSFGADATRVAQHTAASVQGQRAGEVIPTLKHFPGHGDTATDSHLGLPVVPYDLARLEQLELVPFQGGIAAGAECVMMAHIALPYLTASLSASLPHLPTTLPASLPATLLPASLSPAVVRGLLRERLGFEGVVLTDCLEMQAITDTVGVAHGAVLALQAGNDLVLISHHYSRQSAGIAAVRRAVAEGMLSMDAIQRAAERVLDLKRRHLTWEGLPEASGLPVVGCPAHLALRDAAYARSTTLARNDDGLVPLHLAPSEQLLVLIVPPSRRLVSQAAESSFSVAPFVAQIRKRHRNTTAVTAPPLDAEPAGTQAGEDALQAVLAALAAADIVLLVTVNAHRDQSQGELLHALLRQRTQRVIGVAVGDPYELVAFPTLRTYLATYEFSAPALTTAAAVLFGERPAVGRLPVSLEGSLA